MNKEEFDKINTFPIHLEYVKSTGEAEIVLVLSKGTQVWDGDKREVFNTIDRRELPYQNCERIRLIPKDFNIKTPNLPNQPLKEEPKQKTYTAEADIKIHSAGVIVRVAMYNDDSLSFSIQGVSKDTEKELDRIWHVVKGMFNKNTETPEPPNPAPNSGQSVSKSNYPLAGDLLNILKEQWLNFCKFESAELLRTRVSANHQHDKNRYEIDTVIGKIRITKEYDPEFKQYSYCMFFFPVIHSSLSDTQKNISITDVEYNALKCALLGES